MLLQSVYKAEKDMYLCPEAVRTVLINSGQPQQNGASFPATEHIGPLPDVYVAIQNALAGVGIAESMENTVNVYPNPGNGHFTLRFTDNYPEGLTIVNAVGETVCKIPAVPTSEMLEVDLSSQPKGVYFVRLSFDGSPVIKKIIIR